MSNNDVKTILTADNAQFDNAQKQSGEVATASGRSIANAAKRAGDAQKFASKFASDAVNESSIRISAALQRQAAAQADYSRALKIGRSGYLENAQAANVMAASLQRLEHAQKAVMEAKGRAGSDAFLERLGERAVKVAEYAGLYEGMRLAADGLKELISGSIEYVDAMGKLSEKTGVAVGTLSVLALAAKETDTQQEVLSKGMVRLTRSMQDASDGIALPKKAFKDLGITMADLKSKDPGQIFAEVAEKLGEIESPALRAQVAYSLFGRAGVDLIPIMNKVAEDGFGGLEAKAKRFGVYISGDMVGQIEQLKSDLADFGAAAQGASLEFATGLMPALDGVAKAFTDLIGGGGGFESWGVAVGQQVLLLAADFSKLVEQAQLARADYMEMQALGNMVVHGPDSHLDYTAAQRAAAAQRYQADKDELAAAKALHDQAPRDYEATQATLSAAAMNLGGHQMLSASSKGTGTGDDSGSAARIAAAQAKLAAAQKKADEAKMKAFEAQLASMKLQQGMTVKAEFDFWDRKIDAFRKGSDQYNAIVEKQAALAVKGAQQAHEAILKFQHESNANAKLSPKEAEDGMAEFNERLRQQAEDVSKAGERWKAYNAELTRAVELQIKSGQAMQALRIKHDVETGAITKGQGAQSTADLHAAESKAMIDALQDQLARLQATQANLDPNGKDYERQMPRLMAQQQAVQNQISAAQDEAQRQAMEDQLAVFRETALGGAISALQEFTAASKDSAAMMKQFVDSTLSSVNKALVSDMTTGGGNRFQIRNQWSNVGHGIFSDVASSALKKGEGSLMSAFGIGGVGKLGSKSNPIYTKSADAIAKLPSVPNLPSLPAMPLASPNGMSTTDLNKLLWPTTPSGPLPGGASSSAGGLVASLLKFIPGFADGGTISAGTMAMVGERGPELVQFGSSAHVTPNHKLNTVSTDGGSTTHNWNIDARGSTDPAQTMALVRQGIMEAAPHIIAATHKSSASQRSRMAPSARH